MLLKQKHSHAGIACIWACSALKGTDRSDPEFCLTCVFSDYFLPATQKFRGFRIIVLRKAKKNTIMGREGEVKS